MEQVYSEGKRIYICCHDPDDQEKVWKLFESWWRKQAKAILQNEQSIGIRLSKNMELQCQKLQFVR